MERKKLTIWLFIVLMMLSGMVYASPNKKQKQKQRQKQRSKTAPKDGLQDIEKYISQNRKRTEDYYASQVEELELRAEEEIELFEKIELEALASEAVSVDLLLANRGCIPANYIKNKNGLMLPKERVALAESRIAEKKEEILKNLEQDVANLERQKKHALNVSLVDIKKRLKDNALKPKPKSTYGVVMGIVYGEKEQSGIAVINRKMTRDGDVIHGVKVIKIHRGSVEFEKNGKVWKQKVGEPAGKFWR